MPGEIAIKCSAPKLLGGGRPARVGKRFTRKVPVSEIHKEWVAIQQNISALSTSHYHDTGAFGLLAQKLGWANTVKNRYWLKKTVLKSAPIFASTINSCNEPECNSAKHSNCNDLTECNNDCNNDEHSNIAIIKSNSDLNNNGCSSNSNNNSNTTSDTSDAINEPHIVSGITDCLDNHDSMESADSDASNHCSSSGSTSLGHNRRNCNAEINSRLESSEPNLNYDINDPNKESDVAHIANNDFNRKSNSDDSINIAEICNIPDRVSRNSELNDTLPYFDSNDCRIHLDELNDKSNPSNTECNTEARGYSDTDLNVHVITSDTASNINCQDHSNNRIHTAGDSEAMSTATINNETVSFLLGPGACEEFFKYDLNPHHKFDISMDDWNALKSKASKGKFAAGTWTEYFIKGLKKSNQYCVFAFRHHHVSTACVRRRKIRSPLFTATGRCTMPNCPVTFKLAITNLPTVNVTYSGVVVHNVKDARARNICGATRDILKQTFKHGEKPMKEYINKLNEKSSDQIIAGNFDGLGINASIFRKISSETKHVNKQNDWIKNVDQVRVDLKQADTDSSIIKGFIQHFSISPLCIHFFTEFGIRLWHSLCTRNIAFFDATGTVVQKTESGTELLYYELVFQHTVKGASCIPIAGFLSDQQTEVQIKYFLNAMQQAEKRYFGHSGVSQPMQVNVDHSMAIIVALIKSFNVETLDEYLNRCWRVVNEEARDTDKSKTVIHICLAHFMNSMKRKLLKISKTNFSFIMHCLGLLASCKSFAHMHTLLYNFLIVLRSRFVTDLLITSYNNLTECLNHFDSSSVPLPPDDSDNNTCASTNSNLSNSSKQAIHSEEDHLIIQSESLFKTFRDNLVKRVEDDIRTSEEDIHSDSLDVNDKQSSKFAEYFTKHYITIIPLWSALMIKSNSNKTNSVVEKRFDTLKNISLHISERSRFDDFAVALHSDHTGFQKLAAVNWLKRKRSLNTTVKNDSAILRESWQKKSAFKEPSTLACGKYQKPPTVPYAPHRVSDVNCAKVDVVTANLDSNCAAYETVETTPTCVRPELHSNIEIMKCTKQNETPGRSHTICTRSMNTNLELSTLLSNIHCSMDNFANNCWFNATVQAMCVSEYVTRFLEHEVVFCWTPMRNLLTYLRSSNNFHSIRHCSKTLISKVLNMLLPAGGHDSIVCNEVLVDCDQMHDQQVKQIFMLNQMHDCNEFIEKVFGFIIRAVSNDFISKDTVFCKKCGYVSDSSTTRTILTLGVPGTQNSLSLQNLLDEYGTESRIKEYTCSNCNEAWCSQKCVLDSTPHTLIIHLNRAQFLKGKCKPFKCVTPVNPDFKLIYGQVQFRLRSFIAHIGNSCTSGHYVAVIIHTDGVEQYFSLCDDKCVNTFKCTSNLFPIDYQKNCCILVYDKVTYSDSFLHSVANVLNQLARTKTLQELQKRQLSDIRKQQIVQYCKHLSLITEAAHELCKKLCSNMSPSPCKGYQLVLNIVNYLFDARDLSNSFTILIYDTCEDCGRSFSKFITKTFSQFTVRSLSFPFDGIVDYILQDLVSPCCQTVLSHCQYVITSLPLNIFVHCATSNEKISYDFVGTFQDIECVYASDVAVYKCAGVFVFNDTDSTVIFKEPQSNVCCQDCCLLLHLSHSTLPPTLSLVSPRVGQDSLSYLVNEPKSKSNNSWFSSSLIDSYMKLLSKNHFLKIHSVNSSWVGQILFGLNGKPQPFTFSEESVSELWFNNHYVLIPVNVNNKHWILYVFSVGEKTIYFCDSLNGTYSQHDCQIIRYIAVEYFRKFGAIMSPTCLRFCNYTSADGFPLQTDSSSCGPYVCMMAKAIVFNMQFRFSSQEARLTIADELRNSTLYNISSFERQIELCKFSHRPILSLQQHIPSEYHWLLHSEINETIFVFSCEDERILRDNFWDWGKTVCVLNYNLEILNQIRLNEHGVNLKQSVDANVLACLLHDTNIAARLTN